MPTSLNTNNALSQQHHTVRKSETSHSSPRQGRAKADRLQPSRKPLDLLQPLCAFPRHERHRGAAWTRCATSRPSAAALQSALSPSPQQSGKEPHAAQQQSKTDFRLLANSLSSGNASSCRAALHQLQQSHQNMHVSIFSDHETATLKQAAAEDGTGEL